MRHFPRNIPREIERFLVLIAQADRMARRQPTNKSMTLEGYTAFLEQKKQEAQQ
jgi:hypothetical protein